MKNFTKIKLILILIMLSGCASMSRHNIQDWSKINAGPKPDIEEVKSLIKESVKYSLFDSESAQFREWSSFFKGLEGWSKASPISGVWDICYEVNAKNKFGGYTGFKSFRAYVRNGKVLRTWQYPCDRVGLNDPSRTK